MLAVAAPAGPVVMISGAAADAASTLLREIVMTPPTNLVIMLLCALNPNLRTPTHQVNSLGRDEWRGPDAEKGRRQAAGIF